MKPIFNKLVDVKLDMLEASGATAEEAESIRKTMNIPIFQHLISYTYISLAGRAWKSGFSIGVLVGVILAVIVGLIAVNG
jgi:hypothetical protein